MESVEPDSGGSPVGVEPVRRLPNPYLCGGWPTAISQFVKYRLWDTHLIEQLGEKVDGLDQHQIIDRPCISDDNPHKPLQANCMEVLAVPRQVLPGVGSKDPMRHEKSIEGGLRAEV